MVKSTCEFKEIRRGATGHLCEVSSPQSVFTSEL